MKVLRRRLPLGAVGLMLLLALASVGLVYGNWGQKLSINGNVTTGTVGAEWAAPVGLGCFDNETTKDIAQIKQVVKPGGKSLNVEVLNAYPGFMGDCEVTIQYTGTVPGKIERITFDPKGLTGCQIQQSPGVGSFIATCDGLRVTYDDGLCSQLHEGDRLGASVIVEVLKSAPPDTKLAFNVSVDVVQYNMSACP